jgi:hypothetical protein
MHYSREASGLCRSLDVNISKLRFCGSQQCVGKVRGLGEHLEGKAKADTVLKYTSLMRFDYGAAKLCLIRNAAKY